ncbi:ABC transporter permease [Candidatus Sulfidibacterium hydrothermale]|uniref:ABC transporter permease n=1 Tax=Candidatus Sulfidibacterium hydrothermale TaxID=2875962 RepID=UPI001F0B39E7|nr:ABC transporter permease [Candidatus Sulfidibacterium hydrothermale]UBM61073.1 ABC transporter permease [Candidatus Sulfidibacterium hydrothermale]
MVKRNSFIQGLLHEMHNVINDHSVLLTVLLAPLVYVFLMGSIYQKKEVKKIPFAVVDYDKTPTTRNFTRLLSASPAIRLVSQPATYEKGKAALYSMKVQGFLVFPKGFEKKLLKGEGSDVNLYLNTTRFLPSNDLNRAVNTVFMTVGAGIRLHAYEAKGMNPKYAMELINPVLADVHPVYNATNNYGDYLLPGLLFLILQQTLLIGLGESFVRSREKGNLQEALRGNATDIFGWFGGRVSYYLFLYASYILFYFGYAFHFLDIPLRGSKTALFVISLLFLLVVMIYTMLVASFSKKQIRIMEALAFTSYPLFLLSGYSWPVDAMPAPLQWLARIIPTTPMMDAVTKLCAEGTGWGPILNDILQLLVMLLVSTLLFYWRMAVMKKKLTAVKAPVEIS